MRLNAIYCFASFTLRCAHHVVSPNIRRFSSHSIVLRCGVTVCGRYGCLTSTRNFNADLMYNGSVQTKNEAYDRKPTCTRFCEFSNAQSLVTVVKQRFSLVSNIFISVWKFVFLFSTPFFLLFLREFVFFSLHFKNVISFFFKKRFFFSLKKKCSKLTFKLKKVMKLDQENAQCVFANSYMKQRMNFRIVSF